MQIAVVLEDAQVAELDRLVPDEYPSRAEAVRTAVAAWLLERRSAAIDRRYDEAYGLRPPGLDDVDSGRLSRRGPAPAGWEDLDW